MFSFQAIHNKRKDDQISQLATIVFSFQAIHNVSESLIYRGLNVKELLSCFLFKQFTTAVFLNLMKILMSKSYYRVFFSSNSQPLSCSISLTSKCQRATIVFSFQAIHNGRKRMEDFLPNVKELLSCFLFKQFTTSKQDEVHGELMSKSYYRVFFSSNSQRHGFPLLK